MVWALSKDTMRFDAEETIICTSNITYIHNSLNLGIILEFSENRKQCVIKIGLYKICHASHYNKKVASVLSHCDGTVGSDRDACISKCVSEMSRFTAQKAMACRNPTGALNI